MVASRSHRSATCRRVEPSCMTPTEFHAWSPEHFVVLGVTALTAGLMIATARMRRIRAMRVMEIALATLLVAQWPASYWVNRSGGTLTVDNCYPCHFCDFA